MFSEKRIQVVVDLMETGSDGVTLFPSKTLVLENLRVDLEIKKVFSPVGPTATIKIYGASKQEMNTITTIALRDTIIIEHKRVKIRVDNGNGYFTLFEGCIVEAVPVYQSAPDFYIQIESSVAAYENAMSRPPSSFPVKQVAISDLCKTICADYGVKCVTAPELELMPKVAPKNFEQKGLMARMAAVCEAYGLEMIRTGLEYRVFKRGEGYRPVWTFTPNQMIGYPSYANKMIAISTDDFASVEVCDYFRISGSEIPFANGLWYIVMIQYKLQSKTPNGKWEAIIHGAPQREDKI
ncbi:MAG: hypothetical protein J6S67_09980 [Methanobrevibacter sp.]|nr:hypothetical protein [Methanobrevibacter sp.]